MGPDLVLRFDPLYRNQYPATDHYNVQLVKKGDHHELRKHNLPPFIPTKELNEKLEENGLSEFLEEIRVLLYAYVQRREGFKYVQKTYRENIGEELEVNLSVSYVKFTLQTVTEFPDVVITLQYSLGRCLPEMVDIQPVDSEETYSVSKKMLKQKLEHWKQILYELEIYKAFTEIIPDDS